MQNNKLAVLTDGLNAGSARELWTKIAGRVVEWPEDVKEAGGVLEQLFDDGMKRFVAFGGDELVGRVVTAYRRRADLGSNPLELWPLDVDEAYVAAHVGKPLVPAKAAKLARRGIDDWERIRVGTLKVTASTQPAGWFGFSFGAGWVYQALEARKRARGGASNFVSAFGRLATETLAEHEQLGTLAARMAIDYRPVQKQPDSLVASTLERTAFGLGAAGDLPMMWSQLSPRQLMRRAVTPELLEKKPEGNPFETVHLDSPHGWMLDGRLYGGDDSGVVQVVPGPTVTMVRPATGLKALVDGLFG